VKYGWVLIDISFLQNSYHSYLSTWIPFRFLPFHLESAWIHPPGYGWNAWGRVKYCIEIIMIVSSIVTVCRDNLPPGYVHQGNEVLHGLNEHVNKLSEVQALLEVTKESRWIMAKLCFAIANSMKGLMKL
jgi:hypothetical protein